MNHSFRIKKVYNLYSNFIINIIILVFMGKKLFFMCSIYVFFFADVDTRIDNLLRRGNCVCLRLWSLVLVDHHTSVALLP